MAKLLTRIRPLSPAEISGPADRSRDRYRRTFLSGGSSLVARGINVISMLITVPLVLSHVGSVRYGLWITITAFASLLSFADLGIGNGLLTLLAQATGREDHLYSRRVVSSAFIALLAASALLAVFTIAWAGLVPWPSLFNAADTAASTEAQPAALVFIGIFLTALPVTIVQRIHLALQEGYVNALWQGVGSIFSLAGVAACVRLNAGVPWLVLAAVGGPLLATALQGFRLFLRLHPELRPSVRGWDRQLLGNLMRLGLSFFILQGVMAAVFASDNIIVAQVLGPAEVTVYSVQAQPFLWIGGLASVFLLPLWPAYSESMARNEVSWTRATLRRSVLMALSMTALPGLTLALFGGPIVEKWVGGAFETDRLLMLGLALWISAAALGSALSLLLNAGGAVGFQLVTASLMGVAALLVKVYGTRQWGLLGLVWGTLSVYVIVSLVPTGVYIRHWLRHSLQMSEPRDHRSHDKSPTIDQLPSQLTMTTPSPPSRHSIVEFVRRIQRLANRCLHILRHGGIRQFALFFTEELVRNSCLRLRTRYSPDRQHVSCNICGWSGPRFLTHMGAGYVVWNAMCPRCKAFPRHRGFAWLLEHELETRFADLGSGAGYRLLFAPEPAMYQILTHHLANLEGVDFRPINDLVTRIEDIQELSFADDSVDFVSCFHVVEHVPDDHKALAELRRVLHPNGRAIINVPITFGRRETIEFGEPNPLLNDHYFDYGEEFSDRVAGAGFTGIGYRLSRIVPRDEYDALALQDELIYWVAPAGDAGGDITTPSGKSLLI